MWKTRFFQEPERKGVSLQEQMGMLGWGFVGEYPVVELD